MAHVRAGSGVLHKMKEDQKLKTHRARMKGGEIGARIIDRG